MDELIALEKQIYLVVQKEEEIFNEKAALLRELKSLKDENEVLRIKLNEAEKKVERTEDFLGDSDLFDSENKEIIKNKIDELINRIDNHLRS